MPTTEVWQTLIERQLDSQRGLTLTLNVGLGLRGELRRLLFREGIPFEEEKGWLESVIRVGCTHAEYDWLRRIVEAVNDG